MVQMQTVWLVLASTPPAAAALIALGLCLLRRKVEKDFQQKNPEAPGDWYIVTKKDMMRMYCLMLKAGCLAILISCLKPKMAMMSLAASYSSDEGPSRRSSC